MAYYGGKHDRVLSLYNNLQNNERVNVKEAAQYYDVSTKTIHRDIEDIRNFISESSTSGGELREVVYDRAKDTYRLNEAGKLTAEELFVTSKILLESRGLCKSEFSGIFEKMMQCCSSPQNLKQA